MNHTATDNTNTKTSRYPYGPERFVPETDAVEREGKSDGNQHQKNKKKMEKKKKQKRREERRPLSSSSLPSPAFLGARAPRTPEEQLHVERVYSSRTRLGGESGAFEDPLQLTTPTRKPPCPPAPLPPPPAPSTYVQALHHRHRHHRHQRITSMYNSQPTYNHPSITHTHTTQFTHWHLQ